MDAFFVEFAKLLPNERLYCFALGSFFGFAIGVSFRAITEYCRSKLARKRQAERFAREDRLRAEQEAREKQQKEEQDCARMKEQERIRKFALEARKLGLNYEAIDIVRDSKGRYYCPHCFEDKVITHLPPSSNGYLYCPKCGFYFDRDSVE